MNQLLLSARLCRLPLSLFAACSAFAGFLLVSPHVTRALMPLTAVFLLASGASAFNQWQERDLDSRMARTRTRPLPSGSMRPGQALLFSAFCIAAGLGILFLSGSMTAVVLAVFCMLWYNGIYTLLKRVTAFAAVPGALVGMIPPAIGWVSAGGNLRDRRLLVVCFLFFLWQIPHFWLQVLRHGSEYEQAGMPSLTRVFTRRQLARITFAWICAAAAGCLLLPLYGSVQSRVVHFSFVPLAGWLVWRGSSLLGTNDNAPVSPVLSRSVDIYLLIILVLLSADCSFLRFL